MNEDGDADIQFVIEDVQADLANGNPLCDITYDVQISFNAAAGDYINTVTMDTANRVDPNGDPLTGKVYDTT